MMACKNGHPCCTRTGTHDHLYDPGRCPKCHEPAKQTPRKEAADSAFITDLLNKWLPTPDDDE